MSVVRFLDICYELRLLDPAKKVPDVVNKLMKSGFWTGNPSKKDSYGITKSQVPTMSLEEGRRFATLFYAHSRGR